MIELRTRASVFVGSAGGQKRNVISHLAEHSSQRAVELVAESSPIFVDNLMEEAILVENDASLERDVQILERHRLQMSAMNASQGFERGRDWAGIPDAAKIGGHVHALLLRIQDVCSKTQIFAQ